MGSRPPAANLAIFKTDGGVTARRNWPLTYTLTASNAGPFPVTGAIVTDFFPRLSGVTWTCTASAGSYCPPSGSGVLYSSVNLLVGGTVTYTATGMVLWGTTSPTPNEATIDPPISITDPVTANNSFTISTPVDTNLTSGWLRRARDARAPAPWDGPKRLTVPPGRRIPIYPPAGGPGRPRLPRFRFLLERCDPSL